ncbi:MAG: DUF2252 family protein [Bdellovibrionales bacterium]|nr:DUF2252 family protein [Bdellovibrionales bacterium]
MQCSRAFLGKKAPVFLALSLLLGACASSSTHRAPAREKSAPSVNLRGLYPELSDQAFSLKLKKASNPIKFLRAFPPLYYRLVALYQDSLPEGVRASMSFRGWCAGDAHPENFGTLVGENQGPQFTLLDQDDSGPCSLASDLLRFLIASLQSLPESFSSRETLGRLMDAYFDGAEGRVKLSAPVKKLLEEAAKKSGFDNELRVFEDQAELTSSVTTRERQSISKGLSAIFGSVSEVEATRYAKTSGGSAGLLRYRVRARTKKETIVVELKTLGAPAVFFERDGATPPVDEPRMSDPAFRLKRSLALTAPQGRSRFFQVLLLDNVPMLVSPRYRGIRSVDLERDSDGFSRDVIRVLRDEAAVLGSLHARGSRSISPFLAQLRRVTPEEWELAQAVLWNAILENWDSQASRQ